MKRLVVKISGESLSSTQLGIDAIGLKRTVAMVAAVHQAGFEIGLVFGGGNLIRGQQHQFIDRIIADQMGMYATVINALAVSAELSKQGINNRVMTPSKLPNTLEWDYQQAQQHLQNKCMLLFAGGTGNPLFSTDTAAALRAIQVKADLLVKATKYDGIYDQDPDHNAGAKRLPNLTFKEVLQRRLQVMDLSAFDLCAKHHLAICVFDMKNTENLLKIAQGQAIGSLVKN